MILDMIKVQQRKIMKATKLQGNYRKKLKEMALFKGYYKAKCRSIATVNDYKAKCPSSYSEKLVMVKRIPTMRSKIKLSTSLEQLVI